MDSSCSIGAGDGRQGKRTLVSGERLPEPMPCGRRWWARADPTPPPRRTGLGAATGNGGNGDAGDLMSMPDDTFAMVLTAIDQPQAAACMLATCQRVRAALRGPVPVCAMGPRAPMVVQIQFVSTALCLRGVEPYPGQPLFHRPGLELASARGWVQLFPLLVSHGD